MIIQINKCEEIGQIIKFIPCNVGPDECISENESKYEVYLPHPVWLRYHIFKRWRFFFFSFGNRRLNKSRDKKITGCSFLITESQHSSISVLCHTLSLSRTCVCVCVYAQTHTHISVIISFIYNYQTADVYRAVTKSI